MCGAGLEQHYLDMLKQEQEDKEIEQILFSQASFAAVFFSTFRISVPSKN